MSEQLANAVVPTRQFGPIGLEHLLAYAAASGDHNSIHTDLNLAHEAGLPGIIAHGMLSAGLLAECAKQFMLTQPGDWKLESFQSRFKGMILLGDTLVLSGQVKHVTDNLLRLDLVAKKQDGAVVTTAIAEYRI